MPNTEKDKIKAKKNSDKSKIWCYIKKLYKNLRIFDASVEWIMAFLYVSRLCTMVGEFINKIETI